MSGDPERLQVYVSRSKIAIALAVFGPIGLGSLAAGIAGYPGGWIAAALFLPLAGLLVRQLAVSGTPVLVVDRNGLVIETRGLRKGGRQEFSWEEIERLELLGTITRPPRSLGMTATSHTLHVHVRGREDPVLLGMSHLRGNSLELADEIERVGGVRIARLEQHGALGQAETISKDI